MRCSGSKIKVSRTGWETPSIFFNLGIVQLLGLYSSIKVINKLILFLLSFLHSEDYFHKYDFLRITSRSNLLKNSEMNVDPRMIQNKLAYSNDFMAFFSGIKKLE